MLRYPLILGCAVFVLTAGCGPSVKQLQQCAEVRQQAKEARLQAAAAKKSEAEQGVAAAVEHEGDSQAKAGQPLGPN